MLFDFEDTCKNQQIPSFFTKFLMIRVLITHKYILKVYINIVVEDLMDSSKLSCPALGWLVMTLLK